MVPPPYLEVSLCCSHGKGWQGRESLQAMKCPPPTAPGRRRCPRCSWAHRGEQREMREASPPSGTRGLSLRLLKGSEAGE